MDYNAAFKEKLGKLLFLEMDKEGFKESVHIPTYVDFKNKDLYLPISPEYLTSNEKFTYILFYRRNVFCNRSR